MKSYKQTLNLPKTQFPMKGNLSQKEPEILKYWDKKNIYKIIQEKKGKKKFLIHDGPPYANGNIHIGHAMNKILKDIIIKSKTLSGFNVPYIPFWDCHGLPIEHQIEKKNKNIIINKEKFRKKCKKYVIEQVKKQKNDFIRLGIFADWKNSQLTIDKKLEFNVLNVLKKIIKKKYLYKGLKPVHWCMKCQSALAEAEVDYQDENTNSIIVMFQAIQTENLKKIFPIFNVTSKIHIIIWTTTPWSLPANRAIAVNPNIKYQLIEYEKNYIIIAKKLVKSIMNKIQIKTWNIIQTIIGKKLENLKFIHPFLNFQIPIILSKHVNLDMGTGAVHIAPDHGEDDYLISKKYKIKLTNIIDSKGYYKNNIHNELNNKNIFQCNKNIIKIIKNNKKLLYSDIIQHSYPHCWRHKTPIIYRVTKQWFIKIDEKLKKKIIHKIKEINWIPQWGYKKMYTMLKNRPDWCISRQRTWGIPIILFTHKKTGELHPKTIEIIKKINNMIKKSGSEIWWKIDKKNILGKNYKEYKKSKDILDVWFESGCINELNIYDKNKNNQYINMYLEGTDQYRGWFMSSLIISMIVNQSAPYQEILTHGFAIDQTGKKMSKSIGNIITPNEIIKIFGADILRLWVASTNYSNDVIISKDTFKQITEHYRRIRNTSRFLLSNLYDFNPKIHKINFNNMILLDKWMIENIKNLQNKIIHLYEEYKFHEIIKKIIKFCSIKLGSFYLDIIKDRQYTTQKNSIARRSCQTVMYYIIHSLVRWITPILPFTAHEIWQYIPKKNHNQSIFIKNWFKLKFNYLKTEIIQKKDWNTLNNIKYEINKLIEKEKKIKKINTSLETKIIFYAKDNIYHLLIKLKKELKFMLLVSQTKIKKYKYALKNTHNSIIPGLKILIKKYLGIKCPRCWHYFNKIKIINQDKNICNRCNKNNHENGENRIFL
ncbi:isoleucine--tRNA ligase [Buchnera aphidicola]|uniref:Isoleucine--tRNA ligase n=1 Tax=Buchnera aphidicola (Therioaphis trifolii) TaxID=1241884 RepID=A0A4D6YK91_9GAMM|nr:isoleucine--tRNA ligase [Buchnera aphidicola]QCI27111.1 isoleucine--tRNA ligase [Buchnera aphidicola (Therioaphis trifolii)]